MYQRSTVILFHDMMHKEIEVYVDDMIAKSKTEVEHVEHLLKLFQRLTKYKLCLNPNKCTICTNVVIKWELSRVSISRTAY